MSILNFDNSSELWSFFYDMPGGKWNMSYYKSFKVVKSWFESLVMLMEGGGCGVGLRLRWGFNDAYGTSTTRTSWNTYFKITFDTK